MSYQLIKARSLLSGVNSHLKQGRLLPAVQNLYNAVIIVLKTPTMKAERDEFVELIESAVQGLTLDQQLRATYPLKIVYEPGHEKELMVTLHELMKELQTQTSDEAQDLLRDLERKKEELIEKLHEALERDDLHTATRVADRIFRDSAHDTALKTRVADEFIKSEHFPEALHYLDQILKDDPRAVHLYNRMGMVLRKLKKFDASEEYYLKALKLSPDDEYLWYNLGRLYFDWKQWAKMHKAASKATSLSPDFSEAKKMLSYARKKLSV